MVLVGKAEIKLHLLLELPPASLKYLRWYNFKAKNKVLYFFILTFFTKTKFINQTSNWKKNPSLPPSSGNIQAANPNIHFFKGWPKRYLNFYIHVYTGNLYFWQCTLILVNRDRIIFWVVIMYPTYFFLNQNFWTGIIFKFVVYAVFSFSIP